MSTLDDIKARAEKATEGPWQAGVGSTADDTELVTTREQKASYLADSLNDSESPLWLVDNGAVIPAATGDGPRAEANAEFIAHARTDVPKLVAALEAVEAVVAEHSARTPFPDADKESQWYSLGKQHGYERVLFEIKEALS